MASLVPLGGAPWISSRCRCLEVVDLRNASEAPAERHSRVPLIARVAAVSDDSVPFMLTWRSSVTVTVVSFVAFERQLAAYRYAHFEEVELRSARTLGGLGSSVRFRSLKIRFLRRQLR